MLRHPATTTSLMQALRLGCIDTQPPQPPEYYNIYSAYTSSDRSINQLTYNPFVSSSGCSYCPFVGPNRVTLSKHFNATHTAKRRGKGRLSPGTQGKLKQRLDREHYRDQPPWSIAFYQRFFRGGRGSNCFRVTAPLKQ
jgi:hypothetical protein